MLLCLDGRSLSLSMCLLLGYTVDSALLLRNWVTLLSSINT